jgi:hypothetical protein
MATLLRTLGPAFIIAARARLPGLAEISRWRARLRHIGKLRNGKLDRAFRALHFAEPIAVAMAALIA